MLAILTVLKGVSAVSGLFRLIPLVCWTSSIISYGASNALAAYAEEHKQGDGCLMHAAGRMGWELNLSPQVISA